jgi:hypothetical protein
MTITPEQLPPVRGRIRANVSLAETTWFRVGGQAEWVFKPADAEDLEGFIRALAVIPRLDRGIQPSEQEPVDPAVKPRGDGHLCSELACFRCRLTIAPMHIQIGFLIQRIERGVVHKSFGDIFA